MYSSDTDAHNHVNSHVLRRIIYVTCQTSHMYNTLPVLFSNLLPSSCVVAQISSLLATLLYETNNILKVSCSIHVKQSLRPTFEYSWGEGVKDVFLPLKSSSVEPVCFTIYHPCIISSLHIYFTSLTITGISHILNENYVSITYVTLEAPELHIEQIDLLLSNKLQILYYQENVKHN